MTTKKKAARPEDLLGNAAFLITDVARLYRTTFDRRMKKFALDRSQWWLVAFLVYYDGSSQTALTEVMDIGKSGMAKLIHRLEKLGLVSREGHDEDRRSKRVSLTPRGRALAGKVDQASDQTISKSMSALSAEEIASLKKILVKVRAALVEQQQSLD